jgi:long-chain-fatty-acid--CoA ligase ACSBG
MSDSSSSGEQLWYMEPQALATAAALGAALLYFFMTRPRRVNNYVEAGSDELCDYADGNPVRDSKPQSDRAIRRAKTGVAANKPVTVVEQIRAAAEGRNGQNVAMRHERKNAAGEMVWESWTWAEYYEQAQIAARAYIKLGLQPYEAVNIIGFNSPEWLIADIGAILAGGLAAGIYTTNSAEACRYVCDHSKGRVAVVEDAKQLAKFEEFASDSETLDAIVVYSHAYVSEGRTEEDVPIYSWAEFMAAGAVDEGEGADATGWPSNELALRMAAQKPSDCCTLIYTSGTTGNPKAVMCSHDNVTWTGLALLTQSAELKWGETKDGEHIVSYLPLSHIAAQMIDIHLPMFWAASSTYGATTHFARKTALKVCAMLISSCSPGPVFFCCSRILLFAHYSFVCC